VNEHSGHGRALNDAEKLRFGFAHGEVGARLLSRWGVPEPVFMPVLCHHQTGWEGIHARLEAIICLSDCIAHRLVQEKASKLAEPGEAVPAMEFLGITSEGLAALELLASNDLNRLGPLFKN
jgi:HD-like signal output (HDOD) protein